MLSLTCIFNIYIDLLGVQNPDYYKSANVLPRFDLNITATYFASFGSTNYGPNVKNDGLGVHTP